MRRLRGDGAYDKRKVFDAWADPARGPPIRPIIAPRKDAKIEQHSNPQAAPLARDETLRAIRQQGRRAWKRPVAILAAHWPKRSCFATSGSWAAPCGLGVWPTNSVKLGWAVRCSTGCCIWVNRNPIRWTKGLKPHRAGNDIPGRFLCNKAPYVPKNLVCALVVVCWRGRTLRLGNFRPEIRFRPEPQSPPARAHVRRGLRLWGRSAGFRSGPAVVRPRRAADRADECAPHHPPVYQTRPARRHLSRSALGRGARAGRPHGGLGAGDHRHQHARVSACDGP